MAVTIAYFGARLFAESPLENDTEISEVVLRSLGEEGDLYNSCPDAALEKETAPLVLLVLLGTPDKDTSSTHIFLIKTGSL